MEEKSIKRYFNLRIEANSAAFEHPSIGPNLSPFIDKLKITQFCNEFNNLTKIYFSTEIKIFVKLFLRHDKSFFF